MTSMTDPGMTFFAVPPCTVVTETTALSNGSVSRATTCCTFVITCAATATGSTSIWCTAARPEYGVAHSWSPSKCCHR